MHETIFQDWASSDADICRLAIVNKVAIQCFSLLFLVKSTNFMDYVGY